MGILRWRIAFAVSVGLAGVGCRPSIGDPCETSLDCSQQGDRLCDASQLEGYCTIFNCEPDKCPDETICIGFGEQLDPKCSNFDPRWPRFERSFCMKPCDDNSDCRDGYECQTPVERRSVQIDLDPALLGKKACYPATSAPPDVITNAESCTPPSTGTEGSTSSGG
jgi:hypothetical protein